MLEIFAGQPSPEVVALVGDVRLAGELNRGLLELEGLPNPRKPTVVATVGGRVEGFLQYSVYREGMSVSLAHVRLALRIAGPLRLLRSIPRLQARQRVDLEHPADTLYVAELHVDPARRGEGIGGRLLDWADARARTLGFRKLSLTTYSTNLARHLYERHGYVVVARRDDPGYERFTGTPGRLLMVKDLTDAANPS